MKSNTKDKLDETENQLPSFIKGNFPGILKLGKCRESIAIGFQNMLEGAVDQESRQS